MTLFLFIMSIVFLLAAIIALSMKIIKDKITTRNVILISIT